MRTRFGLSIIATLAALGAGLLVAGTVMAATATLTADLADAGAGDSDGSGSATITIDTDTGEVCWELAVENVGDVAASHIHEGAAGVDGGVVVPLDVDGFTDTSEGCVTPDGADLDAIIASPADFYVNIHTGDFPGGAIRGQLAGSATPPDTAMGQPSAPFAAIGLLLVLAALALGLRAARRT